jgi:predicted transposase YdaD
LKSPDRERALVQLSVLAGLRHLSSRLRMELKAMAITIDIEKNAILKEILDKGRAEGRAEGRVEGRAEGEVKGRANALVNVLRTRFDRVPRWAQERIAKATAERLDLWMRKAVTADNLEAVVGSRPKSGK